MFHFPVSSPAINNFSKRPRYLLLEDGMQKPRSEPWLFSFLLDCYCFQAPLVDTAKTFMYGHSPIYTYISIIIPRSLHLYLWQVKHMLIISSTLIQYHIINSSHPTPSPMPCFLTLLYNMKSLSPITTHIHLIICMNSIYMAFLELLTCISLINNLSNQSTQFMFSSFCLAL